MVCLEGLRARAKMEMGRFGWKGRKCVGKTYYVAMIDCLGRLRKSESIVMICRVLSSRAVLQLNPIQN